MNAIHLILGWVIVLLLWVFQKPIVTSVQKVVTKRYQPMVFIVYAVALGIITLSLLVYTLQLLHLDLFLHLVLFLVVLLAFFAFLYARDLFLCLAGWLYLVMNEDGIKDKKLILNGENYTLQSAGWFSSEVADSKKTVLLVPNSVFLKAYFAGKKDSEKNK